MKCGKKICAFCGKKYCHRRHRFDYSVRKLLTGLANAALTD